MICGFISKIPWHGFHSREPQQPSVASQALRGLVNAFRKTFLACASGYTILWQQLFKWLTWTGDKGKVPIYSVHIHPDGSRLATGGIGGPSLLEAHI